MSRSPRILGSTGLYHIVFRGINRQNIFEELHNEPETKNFKPTDRKTLADEQVKRKIATILKGEEPHSIGLKPKTERDGIFKCLREKHRSTIGQLERVTGISRGIITRCIK